MTYPIRVVCCSCILLLFTSALGLASEVGEVVFDEHFSSTDGWSPPKAPWLSVVTNGEGGKCVEITPVGQGEGGAIGTRDVWGKVDRSKASAYLLKKNMMAVLGDYRGYELELEFTVKGSDLVAPVKPWDGVRVGMDYQTPTGPYSDVYYNMLSGTFGWKTLSYKIRVPSDVQDMGLSIGMIGSAGSVFFDSVKFTITDTPFSMKEAPQGEVYTGHQLQRLRGFVSEGGVSGGRTSTVLKELAKDWNANVVKIWFPLKGDIDGVNEKLEDWMRRIDEAIDAARENQIYLILHIGAGWNNQEHGRNALFYESQEHAEKFVDVWKQIAKRYKGVKEIYAFELLNESVVRMPIENGCPSYLELMDRAAQAINQIDPERTIIVQTEEWWGTRAYYKMRPLNADNVVYAVHFYSPFPVTHQGVGPFHQGKTQWMSIAYPGECQGVYWDKEMLKKELQPVREFQEAYNVQIIVSEFSCIRWALGATRQKLIKDMLDIYEEYGWDWIYHSYPGWPGWNPRLGSDPWDNYPPVDVTEVELLLRSEFDKNEKPNFNILSE